MCFFHSMLLLSSVNNQVIGVYSFMITHNLSLLVVVVVVVR